MAKTIDCASAYMPAVSRMPDAELSFIMTADQARQAASDVESQTR